MTIDEAIYKLRNTPVDVVVGDALTFALAKRLGIEALERLKEVREAEFILAKSKAEELLPSEGEK